MFSQKRLASIKIYCKDVKMIKMAFCLGSLLILEWIAPAPTLGQAVESRDYVAGKLVELNDCGAWSWFMDERAIVNEGRLIVGSVRAVGQFESHQSDPDWGNVEVAVYIIETETTQRVVLHRHFEQDDHDNPAFLVRPDGRYLAVYTKHGVDRKVYSRISEPGDPLVWGPEHVFQSPSAGRSEADDTVTYSNLFRMPDGRILNFYRGVSHDPNEMCSLDEGQTWNYGGCLLRGRDGYSPYLKYAADGEGTIHFATTDDHPRNYNNSIYHGYLQNKQIHLSDGTAVARLSEGPEPSLNAWDLTKVFQGGPDDVAWIVDLELDAQRRPYLAFSVQRDGRDLPQGQGGLDLRYFFGRWDGSTWHVHEMAYAGTRLYPGEDDYSGLVALHPNDPRTVYISTNADPATGAPLISQADQQRHYELFRGTTTDDGTTWHWQPVTANSTVDNLRPIIPKWKDERTALVWMRGSYRSNHGEWSTAVVALIIPPGELSIPQ